MTGGRARLNIPDMPPTVKTQVAYRDKHRQRDPKKHAHEYEQIVDPRRSGDEDSRIDPRRDNQDAR